MVREYVSFFRTNIEFLASRYCVTVPLVGISAPGPNDISGLLGEINELRNALEDIKSKNVKLI